MSRFGWLFGTLCYVGLTLTWLATQPSVVMTASTVSSLAYAGLYLGLGVLLLGAFARMWPLLQIVALRAAVLVAGAFVAAGSLWGTGISFRAPLWFDAWMASLLGLTIAVMLPRWLPAALTRRWFGLDRRRQPRT